MAGVITSFQRWLFALVILLVIIASIYLSSYGYSVLQSCSNILGLYFTAWLIQFFFTPVVDVLARHHIPRLLAVFYVYLLVLLALIVLAIVAVPEIWQQGNKLVAGMGDKKTYDFIVTTAQGIEKFIVDHFHVPKNSIDKFTSDFSVNFRNGSAVVGAYWQGILQKNFNFSTVASASSSALTFFNGFSNLILNGVLVLILSFYMTLDGHKLVRRFLAYFPPVVGEVMAGVQQIINRKFGGYLRGQIILAASYGVLTFAVAMGFQLDYAAFIAVFAAIMMLIPFVGTFAAIVPPIIFWIVKYPDFPVPNFLLLLAFLIGSQQVVINFLSPRVKGSALGMHPVLVVLGLLLGVKIAGLWGAIFGVPVFGALLESLDLIYRHVMDQRYGFHPGSGEDEETDHDVGVGHDAGPELHDDHIPPQQDDDTEVVAAPAPPMTRAGITLTPSGPLPDARS